MIWISTLLVAYFIILIVFEKVFASKIKDNLTYSFIANFVKIFAFVSIIFLYLTQIPELEKGLNKILESTAFIVGVVVYLLQNTLKNIISGFMMSASKVFSVGDRIILTEKDITGYVESMDLRHTIIRTYQNNRIIIPNSILNEEIIANNNLKDNSSSYPITITFPIQSDIQRNIQIMQDVISSHGDVKNTKIEVLCSEITKDDYTLKAFVFANSVEENFKISSEIRTEIISKINLHNETL